ERGPQGRCALRRRAGQYSGVRTAVAAAHRTKRRAMGRPNDVRMSCGAVHTATKTAARRSRRVVDCPCERRAAVERGLPEAAARPPSKHAPRRQLLAAVRRLADYGQRDDKNQPSRAATLTILCA